MKRKMQRVCAIALLGLAVSAGLAARSRPLAADTVGVTISAPAEVAASSTFKVDVDVTDVTGFDAGQFDVSFDESVVQLDAAADGSIGTTPVPIAAWNKIGEGQYRIVVNVPGVPGVDGCGSLATLNFKAVGEAGATTSINLSNGFLGNNRAEEIPATWSGKSTVLAAADGEARPRTSTDWRLVLLAASLITMVVLSAAWFVLRKANAPKARG